MKLDERGPWSPYPDEEYNYSQVDLTGGWPNDPRSLGRRLADMLAGNLLLIAVCLVLMYVLTKLVT